MGPTTNGTMELMAAAMPNMIWYIAGGAALLLFLWLMQACLSASLARQKGYSGTAGFFIALLLPLGGLIYQAGRPVSPEMEDERQRALAVRIAKAIRRSEQAKAVRPEEESAPIRKKFSK